MQNDKFSVILWYAFYIWFLVAAITLDIVFNWSNTCILHVLTYLRDLFQLHSFFPGLEYEEVNIYDSFP